MSSLIFRKGGWFTKALALFVAQVFLFSSVAFAGPTSAATDVFRQ